MMARKHAYYAGVRMVSYDLIKEFLVAMSVVTVLIVVLAAVFSSPDEPPLTLQSVAHDTPQIYIQTALDELSGTSEVATYGPPYNNQSGSVQYIGPFSPQKLVGVHIPVDTARDLVLTPLSQSAGNSPSLRHALNTFNNASASQQSAWEAAYDKALAKSTASGSQLSVPQCPCGPVAVLMSSMFQLGQSGAMDGLLLTQRQFYQTDYTRPLLYMQNDAVENRASQFNLVGSQWGAMNETGNYPGQAWLWLFTMLYQIPPYTTAWAANTDALAIATISILSLLLLLLPWIPGLNRLPRYLGVYRLIWRDYYREQKPASDSPAATEPPA